MNSSGGLENGNRNMKKDELWFLERISAVFTRNSKQGRILATVFENKKSFLFWKEQKAVFETKKGFCFGKSKKLYLKQRRIFVLERAKAVFETKKSFCFGESKLRNGEKIQYLQPSLFIWEITETLEDRIGDIEIEFQISKELDLWR